jgi:hypothetical protein
MQSSDEVLETLAMMAAYHELKHAIDNGKPSSTAINAMAMLERSIELRMETEERMVKWMEASCESRERMKQAYRRTT